MAPGVGSLGAASKRRRIETAALVVGYAMSRLDRRFLREFSQGSWTAAYAAVASVLRIPPTSVKGLRDEFDPIHANPRRGWVARPMHSNRVRVAEELELASDAALIAMVRDILAGADTRVGEALDLLVPAPGGAAAAAERLLTGRRAEQYFMSNCQSILGQPGSRLRDAREDLTGFDFELLVEPSVVVEVKGLRGTTGDLQFTDREWREAQLRRSRYWLVVVADAITRPFANVVPDPSTCLEMRCQFERSIRPTWRARFRADRGTSEASLVAESRD